MLKTFNEFISEGIEDYKIEKLGNTTSGKIVFSICNHPMHNSFVSQDHQEACDFHDEAIDVYGKKGNEIKVAHHKKQQSLHKAKI